MKTILAILVLFGAVFAHAQLPDAPSAAPHCFHGKMVNGEIASEEVDCATMPEIFAAPKSTFWNFRKSYQDPPLRTNRQVLNRKFIVLHGLAFAAMSVSCARRKENWSSEAPAVGAITGMDYLLSRFFSEAMSVPAPVYAVQHYIRSAR